MEGSKEKVVKSLLVFGMGFRPRQSNRGLKITMIYIGWTIIEYAKSSGLGMQSGWEGGGSGGYWI